MERLQLMLDAMSYEPFYSRGFYQNEEFGLYIGWLVHPNSFSDCMPVTSESGNQVFFIQGEVFTAKEDLRVLRDKGYRFTESDASHLPALYSESRQDEFFRELNGTFAGVLLDRDRRSIRVFNDRLAYERLYYSGDLDGAFHFSSEAKALLAVSPGAREFDRRGLAQVLRYGCTFADTSLYRGISLLPPASIWEFAPRGRAVKQATYFSESDWAEDSSIQSEAFLESVGTVFRRKLPLYFTGGDRPALSVTGGWDTRMILACYRGGRNTLPCYTFAGLDGDTVDLRQARKVADAAGQTHEVVRLQEDFIADFASHAQKTVYVSDGYGSVGLTHEIYLNRKAREISSLRLTGNFGSEVLREMTTFKEIPLAAEWFAGELRAELSESKEQWTSIRSLESTTRLAVFREIPWKIATTVRLAGSQLVVRTPYLDNELLRLSCICPPSVSREFLPLSVLSGENTDLATIPTDRGESSRMGMTALLSQAWHKGTFKLDYLLSERVPDWMPAAIDAANLHRLMPLRHKYLDYRRWMSGPLRSYVEDVLGSSNAFTKNLLGHSVVSRILRDHASGRKNVLPDIQALLTLELIDSCLLRARSSDLSFGQLHGVPLA